MPWQSAGHVKRLVVLEKIFMSYTITTRQSISLFEVQADRKTGKIILFLPTAPRFRKVAFAAFPKSFIFNLGEKLTVYNPTTSVGRTACLGSKNELVKIIGA